MAVPLYNKRKLEKLFERKDRDANLQNYLKIRSELKSGDLLFFSGDHWLSSMIRGRSRSAWSHCGIAVIIEEMNKIEIVMNGKEELIEKEAEKIEQHHDAIIKMLPKEVQENLGVDAHMGSITSPRPPKPPINVVPNRTKKIRKAC